MNSIKLLLVSFTITFIALMTISPANAKHAANVQHFDINNTLSTQFHSNDLINLAGNYSNSFSTGLILSAPVVLSDRNPQLTMDVVNKSNDFFTSAMVFNDKLHQLISYFTTPSSKTLTEPTISTPESEVIEKKCESTFSFS